MRTSRLRGIVVTDQQNHTNKYTSHTTILYIHIHNDFIVIRSKPVLLIVSIIFRRQSMQTSRLTRPTNKLVLNSFFPPSHQIYYPFPFILINYQCLVVSTEWISNYAKHNFFSCLICKIFIQLFLDSE